MTGGRLLKERRKDTMTSLQWVSLRRISLELTAGVGSREKDYFSSGPLREALESIRDSVV